MSQLQTRKRFDLWAQLSTTNAADRTSAARSLVDPEYTDHGLAQSKGSNNPPSSPESPSESDGGHWQSPEYVISSSQGDWSPERTVSEQWLPVVNGPDIYPTSPESVDGPLRSPPPLSPTPSIGSASPPDGHLPPTPGPDVNPPPSSELQRPAEHESESFLDMLLNGKIRRHISGPVAVHATQRELQDTVDPTTYVVAFHPSSAKSQLARVSKHYSDLMKFLSLL